MLRDIAQKECYRILGISKDSSSDQIKTTFKRLALRWHPDRHMDSKELATEKFIEINNAYRIVMRDLQMRSQVSRDVPSPTVESFSPMSSPTHSNNSSTSSYEPSALSFYNASSGSYFTPSSSGINSGKEGLPSFDPLKSSKQSVLDSEMGGNIPVLPTLGYQQTTVTTPRPRMIYANQSVHEPDRLHGQHPSSERKQQSYLPPGPVSHHHQDRVLPHGQSSQYAGYRNDSFRYPPPLFPPEDRLETPPEWIYRLHLTLEELFQGKHCHFQIVRYLRSNRRQTIAVDFDIPPGCQHGTRFVCRGVGHERYDGTYQNVVFAIEEERHRRFVRVDDDLMILVNLSQANLLQVGGKLHLRGLDGVEYIVRTQNSSKQAASKGVCTIVGAGMPVPQGDTVIGRGNLIVCWEFTQPQSKWGLLKRAFRSRR